MSFRRPTLLSTCRTRSHCRQGMQSVARVIGAHPRRRLYSSQTPLVSFEQEKALDDWISRMLTATRRYDDDLSPSKLRDLYCTLPTRDHTNDTVFSSGNPLAPLHTLIFFHPRSREDQLGEDQTDRDFCPPSPFTRRMWAGGAFHFPGRRGSGDSLRMGRHASARTNIGKIEKKGFEKGAPMVFVHQNIS